MNPSDIGLLAILATLVVILFFLAMIEASLLHVRRSAVATLAADGDRRAKRLLTLIDDLPAVMNAVLLAVLLVQVMSTSIAGALAQRWFGGLGITLATVAVTIVLFIYGEAIPKTLAIGDPLRHALRFSPAVRLLTSVMKPLVSVLLRIAAMQSPRQHRAPVHGAVSEGELLLLADEAAAAGHIEDSDAELIERSFTIGDLRVEDILIPLDRVVSVSSSTTVASALAVAIRAGHRRIPVYEDFDHQIIGFVRLRDLANASMTAADRSVAVHLRDAVRVGVDAPIIDVLREMQHAQRHLATAHRADGATVGIITVEDIVEELLGEIEEPDPRLGDDRRTPVHPLQPTPSNNRETRDR